MGIGLFFVGKSAIIVLISDKTQDKIQDKIIEHIGEIMNTLHFKYAVEVEQTRSITQAAENLYMAQPNLSKAIKELEDSLGIIIFERNSKGVTPTKKGMAFLEYAKNVLVQIGKMEALAAEDNASRQYFNLAIPRGSYIANGVTRFVAALDPQKEMDVNIKETNSMDAIAGVSEGTFNLGIVRYQSDYEKYFLDYMEDKNLCQDLIWEFEHLALFSKKHPLAQAPELNREQMEAYVEIVHGDTAVPYLPAQDLRRCERGKEKHRICVYERGSQFDMLTDIPWTYMWVSPIPDALLERYGLVQRRCAGQTARYKDVLIYPREYKFTELDKKFVDQLYASKNEVAFREYR